MVDSLLSFAQRHAMLEDIARIGLTLGRSLLQGDGEPAPVPADAVPIASPCNAADTATPLERLHLLERLWPGMETALVALAQAPRSVLVGQPMPTPLRQTHGGPQVTHAIARHPGCAAVWRRAIAAVENLHAATDPEPHDPRVQERRFQVHSAALVNRFAGTILTELEREAQHLAALAEFCAETDCALRSYKLAAAAGRWRVRPPFVGLPPLTAPERLQLRQGHGVTEGDAAFRALHSHWRTLRHPLHFDWSESPLLFLPALEAWHLYEIWCFLTVARCLQHEGWLPVGASAQTEKAGHRRADGTTARRPVRPIDFGLFHCTPEGLRLRLATGKASQLRFRRPEAAAGRSGTLTLTYQPLFSSANRRTVHKADIHQDPATGVTRANCAVHDNGDGEELACASLSHDMQPDIALQWRGRLYLLDAKYRRYATREAAGAEEEERGYQALLEDIDKMHTYRDSIVRGNRRAVHHAWCLWPGSAERGVIAYPAATADLPFGAAGIGALALRPGSEPQALLRLLQHWLAPRPHRGS